MNNGKKTRVIYKGNERRMCETWFKQVLDISGFCRLKYVSYNIIDYNLLSAFVERWHKETSSFYLLIMEMTMILDDASCLLHLPIVDRLLDHIVLISSLMHLI